MPGYHLPHHLLEWTKRRTALAAQLEHGACGGDYPDAVVILSATLSALAAGLWPGKGIDQQRLVEMFARYCPDDLHPLRICIPLLIGHLEHMDGRGARARLRETFMPFMHSQVLKASDVDQPETAVLECSPELPRKTVRKFACATVLYRELRSGYLHEYRSSVADAFPLADDADEEVSYVNWHGDPVRHIHFPVAWIRKVSESIAASIAERVPGGRVDRPSAWWLDG